MEGDLNSLRIDRSLKHPAGASADGGTRRYPLWIGAGVALVIAAAAVFFWPDKTGSAAAPDPQVPAASGAKLEVAAASVSKDGIVLEATGYIVAAHKIQLAPKVVGRVKWIGVEMGDKVEQGQILVRLEDDEYRARALQATGQLNAAKARLAELENGARPQEIARSMAELEQAQAELENAQVTLKRNEDLVSSKSVAQRDLDDARAAFRSWTARVAAQQQAYELVREGPRPEQIAAARAQVEQAQGSLTLAEVDLNNTEIRAPVSGTILDRNVEVGEYVTTGFVGDNGAKGYVVSMADLNELRVELDISQDDFAKVSANQPCWVSTDAYPDRRYEGSVDLISPEANRQKATVLVKVKITQPDALLRPDMNATVAFRAGQPADGKTPATSSPSSAAPTAKTLRPPEHHT
jgi:HlyD family secretion protein